MGTARRPALSPPPAALPVAAADLGPAMPAALLAASPRSVFQRATRVPYYERVPEKLNGFDRALVSAYGRLSVRLGSLLGVARLRRLAEAVEGRSAEVARWSDRRLR